MPGGRRGLVAPQNTFLDNVIRRSSQLPDTSFLIANAQIIDFPIVYVSDEFSHISGYRKAEIMQKSIKCDFMMGALTDQAAVTKLMTAFEAQETSCHEILYYKKNAVGIWLEVEIVPVKNETDSVVLFLCTYRDITAFKEPLAEANMFAGLSKFAKIAWTLTSQLRSKNAANRVQAVDPKPAGSREGLQKGISEVVPGYKHEPPQTPPHILLHYCNFKVMWDWIILALTFYTVIIVPYNLAMNRLISSRSSVDISSVRMVVLDSVVDIIFFIDIIFNFHTSFVGNSGEVVTDQNKIRRHYLRSGFLIDVMACLPYDILDSFSAYTSSYTDILSILKLMRLFRLGRVARALHRFLESSFALLLLMLSFYMIVVHWFACVWYIIGHSDLTNGVLFGWLSALGNKTGQPFIADYSSNSTEIPRYPSISGGPSIFSMYVTALYFTMTCMTSIGFGNVAADTDNEKVFCLCMMIVSSLLYAAIFGHVTTIIHNMTQATAKYHEMLDAVREFMTLNEVPQNLMERVTDYIVSKWTNTKGVEQDKVLSICPKDMRADICVHLNRKVFNGHPAFRLASDGCLRSLATNFKMTHCAPGDFIIRKGESITDLCFVVCGSLEVIQQDGEILAFLGRNDVCGDSHWRESKLGKSVVHVRALTYCDIHTIQVDRLKEVLEFYKPFAHTFSRNLALTFDLSKRVVFAKVAEKRLEQIYGEVQQWERPFTPSQIVLLKKVVNKFKSKVRGEEDGSEVPLLPEGARTPTLLALPPSSSALSPVSSPRPYKWNFLSKKNTVPPIIKEQDEEIKDLEAKPEPSPSPSILNDIEQYRLEVKSEIKMIEDKISNIESLLKLVIIKLGIDTLQSNDTEIVDKEIQKIETEIQIIDTEIQ
ncbi:potassium voltage-gated channel protein eag isoform X3 [Eurytemora carolleeae]|uniref:potassium voltage-gated channel protein eag isoform X3 n=1 Tax=Eurytemora carolleeae TaxID=1294199 RepID=UPI000C76A17A|nr:potassium voltage-gated channel protein eag isoform X3 [Eurytemora carolleeae]|eukprot:XP_023349841.1 potassium voltage-gated channel protein eag-like isoform X3 [Eurytemora affinis]